MKILFQSRANIMSVYGGDTVQLLKTKEYLEKLGVTIEISTDLEPNLTGIDVVHIFNLMRGQETLVQVENAKKQGKPVVLSTIYGLYTEYERRARGGLLQIANNLMTKYQIEYCKILARAVINREFHSGTRKVLLTGYKRTLKEICRKTDVFLPNSDSEMQRVISDFKLKDCKYISVPNAVDLSVFDYDNVKVADDLKQYEGCVLCVARIDGRKNQYNVVSALNGAPYKVLIVGKPAPNHMKYYDRIKDIAQDNIIFLSHMNHETLAALYKIAKVHILASWMETPGLSTLEAAVMKTNIVVTRMGDTYDYFLDYAYYCEPDNLNSIREQTDLAYNTPFDERLRELIMKQYTWTTTASLTLNAYRMVYNEK